MMETSRLEIYVVAGIVVALAVAITLQMLFFTSGGNRLLGYGRYAVTQIRIYPVRGMGAQRAASWQFDEQGLDYDGRFAVVCGGKVVEAPFLRPKVDLHRGELLIDGYLTVPLTARHGEPFELEGQQAVDCGDDAAVWLTRELQKEAARAVSSEEKILEASDEYRLARFLKEEDGSNNKKYVLTVACEGSLKRVADGSMDRLRPNLVVATSRPFVEDYWQTLKLKPDVKLRVLEPKRCDAPPRHVFGLHVAFADASLAAGQRVCLGDYLHVTRFRPQSWLHDDNKRRR